MRGDRVHRDDRRVERVDPELRQAAGMRSLAEKADLLDEGPIRGFGEDGPRLRTVARAGMDHHRHVDIVEMALGDELGLAEHEFDLALGDAPHALLDIDELLGRHGEKDNLAGEMVGGLHIAEPDRGTEHAGDLRVVAAAVRRPGGRIGERVVRGAQAVELADQGEPRPRRPSCEPALDPGQGQTGARREAQGSHALSDQSGRLDLVEAGLGIAQDRFAEIDDRVGMAIDRLANRALQFILTVHFSSQPPDPIAYSADG